MCEEVSMGLTLQVPLAQCFEGRHLLNTIGVEMLKLELDALERTAEEGTSRNPETSVVESHERDYVVGRRRRSPLLPRDDPLLRISAGRKRALRHQSLEVPGPNRGLRPVRHWRWGKVGRRRRARKT